MAHRLGLFRLFFPLVVLLAGCDAASTLRAMHDLPEEPPEFPVRDEASITDRHGGTHHRSIVRGRIWYQTFGTELLVLDAHDGAVISRVEPIAFGNAGALVDIAIIGKRMYLVADGDAVIELDIAEQRRPSVLQVHDSDKLGVHPRALAAIDGELWISGDGGVVRWNGSKTPLLPGEQVEAPVVKTTSGLAVPVGRRVHLIEDGAYLGAATLLQPLQKDSGLEGKFLFVLQGAEGASVGVMNEEIRQIADFAVRGEVRGIAFANGRLWAISDTELASSEIRMDGTLGPVDWVKVKGARDLDGAGPNYLVIAGSFGRALYRQVQDPTGDGDSFLAVTREPGSLLAAVDDGRRAMAGSPEGVWIYTIGESVELTDRQQTMDTPGADFAAGQWGDARIVDDGASVIIHLDEGDREWRAPKGAKVQTLVVTGNNLWIGHDQGLSMIKINGSREAALNSYFDMPPPPRIELAGQFRIQSGVTHVLPPRVGRDVVWVSPYGGIGVASVEEVERVTAGDAD